MKKILQATGKKNHAGLAGLLRHDRDHNKSPLRPVDQMIDMGAFDQDTRRAIHILLFRMSPHARRALIHGASIEAMLQLPSVYLINPFFADAQLGPDGLDVFKNLAAASENRQLQSTAKLIQSLTGALRASAD